MNNPFYKQRVSCSCCPGVAEHNSSAGNSLMLSTNLFLLRLCLGLQAADLLLGQRHGILLLLRRPEPELEVCHLPLQLHDPGALRHRGHLQQNM